MISVDKPSNDYMDIDTMDDITMSGEYFYRSRFTSRLSISNKQNELSWNEVKDILNDVENLYLQDAQGDPQQIRKLVSNQDKIVEGCSAKQNESKMRLQELISQVQQSEDKKNKANAHSEYIRNKIQEIDSCKRDLMAQLAGIHCLILSPSSLTADFFLFTSAQEHHASLLNKYEEARKEILSYGALHQADIPRAKHQLGLYASITGIKWSLSTPIVGGEIFVPLKQEMHQFEFNVDDDEFDAANAIWDEIDDLFDDVNHDL
uniref:Uncharacterized protein AlNc14C1G149 n=1 Tax=Albugo laibachii Nc14 TaxID=890382 RepID=F0VZ02_9STRA|nr:conserved hypothetical protein [Albugo laibachii Nc14]|eukprot:CCA14017.1 conserved hypothetical protein [Albugo laibachii Nc14]